MKYERNREHFAISAGDSHVCFFRLQCVVTAHHRQGLSWYALLLLLLILEVLIVRAGSAFLRFARVPRVMRVCVSRVLFCAGSALGCLPIA